MELYLICQVEKLMHYKESEFYFFYSDASLTLSEKEGLPSYLEPYYVTSDHEYADEFIRKNITNLYECGSYPYCALVKIRLDGLVPYERTISLYEYQEKECRYTKKRNLTKDEILLCPKVYI